MSASAPATPWVLLRGLGREQAHWGDFAQHCREVLGADVVTIDLPGCGEYYRQRSPDTIAALREAAAGQLECAIGHRSFSLLGISMGATVALDWALAEPERVKGLVLVNASSRFSPMMHRLKVGSLARVLACLLDPNIERCEKRILNMVSNLRQRDGALLAHWCAIQKRRPVSKMNIVRQLKATGRYRFDGAPACPTLVVTSRADRMVDWRCSRRIAEEFGATLALHDRAGHDLPVDAPDWLLATILEWCDQRH